MHLSQASGPPASRLPVSRLPVSRLPVSRLPIVRFHACLAALLATGAPGSADPIATTVIVNLTPEPPSITVTQREGPGGVLRYDAVVEETARFNAWVKGRCDTNWRIQAASINSCHPEAEGRALEVCPGNADTPPAFFEILDVNQSNQTLGPREPVLDVPREVFADWLIDRGEALIAQLGEQTEWTPTAWRALDLRLTAEFELGFTFQCRRFFGNNDPAFKTDRTVFPIDVTYRGAVAEGGEFVPGAGPGEAPDPGVVPIPYGDLTGETRIERARLIILPDERREACGFHLSASVTTSGPTTVRYRLADDTGALSPEFTLEVDQTGVAFASHDIAFEGGSEGMPFGFTAVSGDDDDPGGAAFGGMLAQEAGDRLRGFYRMEISAPHRAASNFASYNLEDCTAGMGPDLSVFSTVVLGDAEEARTRLRTITAATQPAGAAE